MKKFLINLGLLIIHFGKFIQPDYWVCTNCASIKYKEEEIRCWDCGIGEMIYKGEIPKRSIMSIIDRLKTKLDKHGIKVSRIARTDEAFCVVLNHGNVEIYIEYYFDGDIALVAGDIEQKKVLTSIDLNEDEVLPKILKYYDLC